MLPLYKRSLTSTTTLAASRLLWNTTARTNVSNKIRARFVSTETAPPIQPQGKTMRIERELPDPRTDRTKMVGGFFLFSGIMVTALAMIFNYEKTENPIVSTTLYQLRRSDLTRNILGENIEFDGVIPWVYGKLNPVAGKVNIRFYIKGDKNKTGEIKLVADRANRNQEFLIHEWSLTVDGTQVDLLDENTFLLD
ncbi:cytochrome c oxidase assembly factor 1 [Monosporozyma servazzii]